MKPFFKNKFIFFLNSDVLFLMLICTLGTLFICSQNLWNSDLAVIETLYQDYIHGTNISQWKLPPAPSVFPDWLVYFFLRFTLQGANSTLVAYVFASLFSFMLLSQKLFSEIRDNSKIKLSYLCFLSFLLIWPKEWLVLFIPIHHGGVFLISLLVLTISKKYLEDSVLKNSVLFPLIALSIISDYFIIIWFLIPLSCYYSSLFLKKEITIKILLQKGLTIAFTILISIILKPYLFHFLEFNSLIQNTNSMLSGFFNFDKGYKLINHFLNYKVKLLILIFALFFIHKTNFWFNLKIQKHNLKKINILQFFYLSSVTSLFFVFAFSLFEDSYNVRYLFPVYLTMMFILTIMILNLYDQHLIHIKIDNFKNNLKSKAILVAVFFIFLFSVSIKNFTTSLASSDFSLIASHRFNGDISTKCINDYLFTQNLIEQKGLSTYWPYKMTLLQSDFKLKALQVTQDLKPYYWLNNPEWSREIDIDSTKFMLIERHEELIAIQNLSSIGKPITNIKDCQKYLILKF